MAKRAVKSSGIDPAHYAGHSLRSGFVTEATRRHKDVVEIMRQTGHRDPRTVDKYVRIANPFEKNAAVGLKAYDPETGATQPVGKEADKKK